MTDKNVPLHRVRDYMSVILSEFIYDARLWADGNCSRHVLGLRAYLTTVWLAKTLRRQMMRWFSERMQKEAGEIFLKAVSQTVLRRTQWIRDQFPGIPVMANLTCTYSLINGIMLC